MTSCDVQVVATNSPSWSPLSTATSRSCDLSDGYASGLLHLHLYVVALPAGATGGSTMQAPQAVPHELAEDVHDPRPSASDSLPGDALETKASFGSSVWRSLTRAESSIAAQAASSPSSLPDSPTGSNDETHPCCAAAKLPGRLVAAVSFDLASVTRVAADPAGLAALDCAYPPATLILELSDGLYSVPALSPAAGASTASLAAGNDDDSPAEAPAGQVLPLPG